MATGSISFLAALQALDHGDHGDHSVHGDFIASSGAPSGAASALVMSHAVLSGPWTWEQSFAPDHLDFGDGKNAVLWSQDVRTMVAQQEIASSIVVEKSTPTGALPKVELKTRLGPAAQSLIASLERPGKDIFAKQLDHLEYYADQRVERLPEIILQISDIISNFAAVVPLRPERKRWTLEYIRICLRAVSLVEMQVKHMMACRRPLDYYAQVQPMIQTPQHSALPSGHATEAFLVSTILNHFAEASSLNVPLPGGGRPWFAKAQSQLLRQAARIAQNRVVAGVHFPIDNAAGAVLGVSFANYLISLSGGGDPAQTVGRTFLAAFDDSDFTYETADGIYGDGNLNTGEQDYSRKLDVAFTPTPDTVLSKIYDAAMAEWSDPA